MSKNCLQQEWKHKVKDSKGKKTSRTDYNKYIFSPVEIFRYGTEGAMVVGVLGYFFYRSIVITLILSPAILVYLREKKKWLCQKRKQELSIQFKDALNSINGSLQAGYSMENAFSEAYGDMVEYHGTESIIAKELFTIKSGIRNNQPLEDLVEDLGNRSGIEDIRDFAGIIRIGKHSGGNLYALFNNSISVIEEKLTVTQEIQTLISSKKLESNIMCVVPFGIILYVELTSKGYFDGLYTTMAGRILMTVCLLVYVFAFHLSRKIMEIEV